MEVLRLRKMALKSVINIGAFNDVTVQNAIDMGKIGGLISLYFGLGKISFIDDVLDILGISKDLRIEKPGKIENLDLRKESINKALNNYYVDLTEKERMHMSNKKKSDKKRRSTRTINVIANAPKGKMQRINQHGFTPKIKY